MQVGELSIEEKARRYDRAIEELRGMMPNWERLSYNGKTFLQDLTHILPELAESEDERIRKELIRETKGSEIKLFEAVTNEEFVAWLERQREQKIAEWSEEDERMYQSIMDDTIQENQLNGEQTNWLRDIKYRHFSQSQSRWRPSGEQMKYLWKYAEQNNYDGSILTSLYNDLKKLKGRSYESE